MILRRRPAFSIIELVAVLGIIAVLMMALGPRIKNLLFSGKKSATETKLNTVKNVVNEFVIQTGHYPKSFSDMTKKAAKTTNFTGPFLDEKDMSDAWNNAMVFNCPPKRFKNLFKKYEIYSLGADEEESEDDIKDGE